MEIYLRKYSPVVYSRKYRQPVPAWQAYQDVMAILNMKGDDERMQRLIDEYRAKILGKSCLVSAPSEYWEIRLITELGISPSDWKSFALHEKAKIMAVNYLKNMVATVDRHYEEQDEQEKKKNGKTGS